MIRSLRASTKCERERRHKVRFMCASPSIGEGTKRRSIRREIARSVIVTMSGERRTHKVVLSRTTALFALSLTFPLDHFFFFLRGNQRASQEVSNGIVSCRDGSVSCREG